MAELTVLAFVDDQMLRRKLSVFFAQSNDQLFFERDISKGSVYAEAMGANLILFEAAQANMASAEGATLPEKVPVVAFFNTSPSECQKIQNTHEDCLVVQQSFAAEELQAFERFVASLRVDETPFWEKSDGFDDFAECLDLACASIFHFKGHYFDLLHSVQAFFTRIFSGLLVDTYIVEQESNHLVNINALDKKFALAKDQWKNSPATMFEATNRYVSEAIQVFTIDNGDQLFSVVCTPKLNLIDPLHQTLIRMILAHVRLVLMDAMLVKSDAKSGYRDAYTDLYNEHYFFDYLFAEASRASRYSFEIAVVLVNPDLSKLSLEMRDGAYGALARDIRKQVRMSDVVCRLDDGLIGLILPQTNAEGVKLKIDRVYEQLQSRFGSIEIDFGWSVFPDDAVADSNKDIAGLLFQKAKTRFKNFNK